MGQENQKPGELAQHSGEYEELNVFGSPTGWRMFVDKDKPLPSLPRGFTWRHTLRPLPSEMTVAELREGAAEYRRMAQTASTVGVRDALLRLADRYEALAEKRGS